MGGKKKRAPLLVTARERDTGFRGCWGNGVKNIRREIVGAK